MSKPIPDTRDTWRIFRIMSEFVEGFETLGSVGKAVSIFGSARTEPHNRYYKAAQETARLLVKSGYAVITGGGPGIMEAGNKGAFESHGTSIGLNISLPQEQESNRYQNISVDFHYFYARKVMFVKYASAFICFPGGFGTLDEFFETMTLIQTLKVESFPVILFGTPFWSGLVEWMRQQMIPEFIHKGDTDIFRLVDRPKDAVALVLESEKRHWWTPANKNLKRLDVETHLRTPLASSAATESGEGTRDGKRPVHTKKSVARAEPDAKK